MQKYGTLPAPTRSYTVTFNANGGNTPNPASKTVTYTFAGWYTAASGGTKVESTSIMNTRGGTLYARWTAPIYGDLATCSRGASGGYTYSFKGWYTATSGGTKIESSTTVNLTANQILYAQWNATAQSATVTITYGDGISKVTVNEINVGNGWSGKIKQGDVIKAYGAHGASTGATTAPPTTSATVLLLPVSRLRRLVPVRSTSATASTT